MYTSSSPVPPRHPHSFPTRRSSDLDARRAVLVRGRDGVRDPVGPDLARIVVADRDARLDPGPELEQLGARVAPGELCVRRSEEHTSELQSRRDLVCRLLLEKKNKRY